MKKEFRLPKVGNGATVLCGEDRKAFTVIVIDEDTGVVLIQRDIAIRLERVSDAQVFDYKKDTGGTVKVVTFINGRWELIGEEVEVIFGERDEYWS